MAKPSTVNPDPQSDGYKFAAFILRYFGKDDPYDVIYNYNKIVEKQKFDGPTRRQIQKRLKKLNRDDLWPELQKRISGYQEEIRLSKADYVKLLGRLTTLEKKVEKLEVIINEK